MKSFHLIPVSFTHGVFYDDDKPSLAVFLTPQEAKFQAAFRSMREAQNRS